MEPGPGRCAAGAPGQPPAGEDRGTLAQRRRLRRGHPRRPQLRGRARTSGVPARLGRLRGPPASRRLGRARHALLLFASVNRGFNPRNRHPLRVLYLLFQLCPLYRSMLARKLEVGSDFITDSGFGGSGIFGRSRRRWPSCNCWGRRMASSPATTAGISRSFRARGRSRCPGPITPTSTAWTGRQTRKSAMD